MSLMVEDLLSKFPLLPVKKSSQPSVTLVSDPWGLARLGR